MNALAKTWTWVGYLIVTTSGGIWMHIAGGVFDPISYGQQISLSLWGIVIVCSGGTLLALIGISYHKQLTGAEPFGWPENTTFEDKERHKLVSKLTLWIYIIIPFAALVACVSKYSESEVTEWDQSKPLANSFFLSRAEAYLQGCDGGACFRVSPVDGHEYLLYLTDGALLIFVAMYLGVTSLWVFRVFCFSSSRSD